MSTVLSLSASPSPQSRTAAVRRHVDGLLTAAGHDVLPVDVRDLPAAPLLSGQVSDPRLAAVLDGVERADGVVVATPVFKASYSGLLKALLDVLPEKALAGRAVLPLATGGTLAHVLMLDHALRPVLAALGADEMAPGRFVLGTQVPLKGGRYAPDADAESALGLATRPFLDALARRTPVTHGPGTRPTAPALVPGIAQDPQARTSARA
ncbi:NADPH-dependent FMN reductase [Streptomyces sp. OE57]|uniref:NADPH-dependent FMN reductase n=1 Tax=Streptomyces lacaronensis TaxID=3379885 RepID=UPI0039B776C9